MSGVTELGYIVIEASDLAAWDAYATGILGLMPAGNGAYRMDGKAHRITLTEGPADDLAALGFDCGDQLDAVAAAGYTMGACVPSGNTPTTRTRGSARASVVYTMPSGASPRATKLSAARTSPAGASLASTLVHTPQRWSAAFA